MLTIKTRIGPSTIHGIGLFAGEAVSAGAMLWSYSAAVDRMYAPLALALMPEPVRTQLMNYCYMNDTEQVVVCGDDARFWNFSETPNCDLAPAEAGESPVVALRDIQRGEELTISFSSDRDYKRKMEVLNL